jgi:hypothetical protein
MVAIYAAARRRGVPYLEAIDEVLNTRPVYLISMARGEPGSL